VEKDLKKKKEPVLEQELILLNRCKAGIESEKPLREMEFNPEERKMIYGYKFLSQRPMLYVLNLGDSEVAELDTAVERHKLGKLVGRPNTVVLSICGRIEAELAELEPAEAAEMLTAYGLKSSGLDRIIQATYQLLGLTSFFTAGEPEVRAWTIKRRDPFRHRARIHSRGSRALRRLAGCRKLAGGPRTRASAPRREGIHRPGRRRHPVSS
jgi:ribosome-binding ATPase YchF (GTP1/OBG family)